jgi:hypothetical protein
MGVGSKQIQNNNETTQWGPICSAYAGEQSIAVSVSLYKAASCMVASNQHYTSAVHLVQPLYQRCLEPVAVRIGKVDKIAIEFVDLK